MHRRDQLVAAVLCEIGRTGRPTVSARLLADIDAVFGDFGGFLIELQLRWYRAFDARMDAVLETLPDDVSAAVADVWCELGDAMPAARLLLDVHAGHPPDGRGRAGRHLHRAAPARRDPARRRRLAGHGR